MTSRQFRAYLSGAYRSRLHLGSGPLVKFHCRYYDAFSTESKWQKRWRQNAVPTGDCPSINCSKHLPKKYILSMFPYPSGDLHMGHVRVYTISDTLARYWRMRGHNVLHPMGWDAFGLPAENAARDRGIDASVWTQQNIASMRTQLDALGMSFDWETRQLSTCDPAYYRWTQHLFLRLHRAGLVYRALAPVNYDPVDQTVLANEQVDAQGRSWRSGALVERRVLPQWFVRITAFAPQLLAGLDQLSGAWPAQVLALQRNWIGQSDGVLITFAGHGAAPPIAVFTTRPETLAGATFVAVSATHSVLAGEHVPEDRRHAVRQFIETRSARAAAPGQPDQHDAGGGVFTGLLVQHPLDSTRLLPVFAADYVLDTVGTGAVMGVPHHDDRDGRFAEAASRGNSSAEGAAPFTGLRGHPVIDLTASDPVLCNCGPRYDGLSVEQGARRVVEDGETAGWARRTTQYRLRDWLVSRQRSWGTPIPMVHCHHCGPEPVPLTDAQLPVTLDDAECGTATCPRCGASGQPRERDTMDTFVDSAWYWARYCSAQASDCMVRPEDAQRWLPVDVYIGGVEHAILHLLYARFIGHFLHAEGVVPSAEPFPRLLAQGMVLGQTFRDQASGRPVPGHAVDKARAEGRTLTSRWEKMSKSKHNGVNPSSVVEQYGADTARLFVLFKAPAPVALEWDESGVRGMSRWLNRMHRVFCALWQPVPGNAAATEVASSHAAASDLHCLVQSTVSQVERDIERDSFNTAISALMVLSNELSRLGGAAAGPTESVARDDLHGAARCLVLLLAPFAPHFASEHWSMAVRAVDEGRAPLHAPPALRRCAGDATQADVFMQRFPRPDPVSRSGVDARHDSSLATLIVQLANGRVIGRCSGVRSVSSASDAAHVALNNAEEAIDERYKPLLVDVANDQNADAKLIQGKKGNLFILKVPA